MKSSKFQLYILTERNLTMSGEHTIYIYICLTVKLYSWNLLDFINQCHHKNKYMKKKKKKKENKMFWPPGHHVVLFGTRVFTEVTSWDKVKLE